LFAVMAGVDIEANVEAYISDRRPTDRYTSFDSCFNYFQSHHESGNLTALTHSAAMQVSCMQLGFYLASWGMMRGSAVLHKRSAKYLAPVIEVIADTTSELWQTDVDGYTPAVCDALIRSSRRIRSAFPEGASDILVTKIMLGVFGSVPAFDTQFKKGSGLTTFSRGSLLRVGEFYREHADVIDNSRVRTLGFDSDEETGRLYTRAKVIDMIFFIEGMPRDASGESR